MRREEVTPYKDSKLAKKQQVSQMFDTISGEYDHLNRVISFGMDQPWRRKVIKLITDRRPNNVLDIATGTGDLAISLAEKGLKNITGLDLSEGMLAVARKKIEEKGLTDKVGTQVGDSENLPFADNHFEAICVAFGVRNFENLEKGLQEIYRVLKPGGIFVVLETAVPRKTPFKQGYKLYAKYILPAIGKLFSKDKSAYGYLSESASVFPCGEDFNNILRKTGFTNVKDRPQTMGAASIYTGSK